MGCGASKVDDLPLVTLCRERKELIKAASNHRYALAAAHVSYFHSLVDVGDAIRKFVDEELVLSSPASPVLPLPREHAKPKSKSSSSSTSLSHSIDNSSSNIKNKKHIEEEEEIDNSSHLHLSDSDPDADLDSDQGHDHTHNVHVEEEEDKPVRSPPVYFEPAQQNWGYNEQGEIPYPYPYPYPYPAAFPDPYSNSNSYPGMYFMKKSATPARTVVYEDPSYSASAYYGNPAGGYFGYPMMGSSSPAPPQSPPKPPPSPPRVSAWDFLNVFDGYDNGGGGGYSGYYNSGGKYGFGSMGSSPDSKEVREREGIPDLEDETEQEVVKEAYEGKKGKKIDEETYNVSGNFGFNDEIKKKFGEGTSKSVPGASTSEGFEESVKGKRVNVSPHTFASPDSVVSRKSIEEESVRKKGVSFEVEGARGMAMDVDESSKQSSLTTLSSRSSRDLQDVVKEIRDEFESATSYGKEVAMMLEVGKLPYQRRSTPLKVIFSRILYLVSSHPPAMPSIQVSSRVMKMAKAYSGEPENSFDMQPRNLSSTLDKLYEWEKKLYKEVKDEERLRVIYEKKCKRLKILDDRGAESSKIDAEQASIRKVLTKINVCIRAVDSISSKIHRLRDEELQPQITELIHRLIRMWKSMLRCHQKQFQAIMESKVRSLKANTGLRTDSGLKATIELERELINWSSRFTSWINTQKSYIESLNEWLLRSLLQEPEETADGIAPFSPSRVGAPPIFVICNDWYQAMDRISEKGVANAMLDFASSLHQLWERQDEEQRHMMKAEYLKKDFEKQLRSLRMERGRIEQEQDASSDKTISKVPSGSGVSRLDDLKVDLDLMRKKLEEERARHKEAAKLVHDAASSSVQAGLVPILEALGNFSSEALKAHEEVRLQYAAGS